MTRADLESWLETRRPIPPAALREHLAKSNHESPVSLPEHLADAGVTLLRRVLSHPEGGRELALDLLTADALVTYAFEAQAERDINGLTALAQRVAGADA